MISPHPVPPTNQMKTNPLPSESVESSEGQRHYWKNSNIRCKCGKETTEQEGVQEGWAPVPLLVKRAVVIGEHKAFLPCEPRKHSKDGPCWETGLCDTFYLLILKLQKSLERGIWWYFYSLQYHSWLCCMGEVRRWGGWEEVVGGFPKLPSLQITQVQISQCPNLCWNGQYCILQVNKAAFTCKYTENE